MSFPFDPALLLEEATPTPGFEADALDAARMLYNRHGQLARRAYVQDAQGCHLFEVPVPHPSLHRIADALMGALSAALEASRATGVALLAEAWTVASAGPRDAFPRDLADAPDRVEIVVVTVEHYAIEGGLPRVWQAAITRDARGRGSLGPWRLMNRKWAAEGRMIGLLRPRGAGA